MTDPADLAHDVLLKVAAFVKSLPAGPARRPRLGRGPADPGPARRPSPPPRPLPARTKPLSRPVAEIETMLAEIGTRADGGAVPERRAAHDRPAPRTGQGPERRPAQQVHQGLHHHEDRRLGRRSPPRLVGHRPHGRPLTVQADERRGRCDLALPHGCGGRRSSRRPGRRRDGAGSLGGGDRLEQLRDPTSWWRAVLVAGATVPAGAGDGESAPVRPVGRGCPERAGCAHGLGDEALSERTGRTANADLADDGDLVGFLAVASEVARDRLGMEPFEVQLLAAVSMLRGRVVDMETGEGKTLVGFLVAAGLAVTGRRVHVLSANDYLAGRDAHAGATLFAAFGCRARRWSMAWTMLGGGRRTAAMWSTRPCTRWDSTYCATGNGRGRAAAGAGTGRGGDR